MTTRYIWQPDDVATLCHGLWLHVSLGPGWTRITAANAFTHAHCCVGCDRRLVCTCLNRAAYDLVTCLWCGLPWTVTWRKVRRRTKGKGKRRRKVAA